MCSVLLRLFFAGSVWLSINPAGAEPASPETLTWRRYADPVFPTELLSTTVRDGFAKVVIDFDTAGRITDCVALGASHPAFVKAVKEAMSDWEIDLQQVARASRREVIRFDFRRQRSAVSLSQRDATKAAFNAHGDQAASVLPTYRESELSSPLEGVSTVLPDYSSQQRARHGQGIATVSFVVDTEGRVRVPAVTYGTDPEFGEAALVAIRRWRFNPVQQNGVPVQVMVERTFRFGPTGDRK